MRDYSLPNRNVLGKRKQFLGPGIEGKQPLVSLRIVSDEPTLREHAQLTEW